MGTTPHWERILLAVNLCFPDIYFNTGSKYNGYTILYPLHSFAVVSTGFEVNQTWLQIGYKKFADAVERLDYLDYVYEKRIEGAVYDEKSRASTRVGMISQSRKALI